MSMDKKKIFVYTDTYIVYIPLFSYRLHGIMTIVFYMSEEERQFDPLHVQTKNCKQTAFVIYLVLLGLSTFLTPGRLDQSA